MDTRTKALQRLMPLGGWSDDGTTVSVHADGTANGYTVPTAQEITDAEADVTSNAPILADIEALDPVITREKEKWAKEDNAYTLSEAEEQAIAEKVALRLTLV